VLRDSNEGSGMDCHNQDQERTLFPDNPPQSPLLNSRSLEESVGGEMASLLTHRITLNVLCELQT
jgi:hypothetical protein